RGAFDPHLEMSGKADRERSARTTHAPLEARARSVPARGRTPRARLVRRGPPRARTGRGERAEGEGAPGAPSARGLRSAFGDVWQGGSGAERAKDTRSFLKPARGASPREGVPRAPDSSERASSRVAFQRRGRRGRAEAAENEPRGRARPGRPRRGAFDPHLE